MPGFGFLPISLVVELESAYEVGCRIISPISFININYKQEYLAVANISRNDVPYDVEDEIKVDD